MYTRADVKRRSRRSVRITGCLVLGRVYYFRPESVVVRSGIGRGRQWRARPANRSEIFDQTTGGGRTTLAARPRFRSAINAHARGRFPAANGTLQTRVHRREQYEQLRSRSARIFRILSNTRATTRYYITYAFLHANCFSRTIYNYTVDDTRFEWTVRYQQTATKRIQTLHRFSLRSLRSTTVPFIFHAAL